MSAYRIASTYAKSVLDLAIDQGNLEEVKADMEGLASCMENRDLYLLLKSPIINADKKQKVLDAIFSGKVNPLTSKFMEIVIRKGRESFLPEIVKAFGDQYRSYKKITTVKLTTAVDIAEEKLARIKSELLKSNVTKESVDITTVTDPDIIGGFVLEVGDKLYDASVAHKLGLLRKEFTGNEYVKEF